MATLIDKFRRDIKTVIWLAISLFIGLSLLTYNPNDPSFNSTSATLTGVSNLCGLIGSFLADILYQGFGLAAWVIVAIIGRLGWVSLSGRSLELRKAKVLWSVMFLVSVSSLMALYVQEKTLFSGNIYVGGMLGSLLSKSMIIYLNEAGAGVMLWSSSLVLFLLYTEKPIEYFFRGPIDFFREVYERSFDSFLEWRETRLAKKNAKPKKSKKKTTTIEDSEEGFLKEVYSSILNLFRSQNSETELVRPKNKKMAIKASDENDDESGEEYEEEYEYEEEEGEDEEGEDEEYEYEEEDEDEFEDELETDSDGQVSMEVGEISAKLPGTQRKKRIRVKQRKRVANWNLPQVNMLEDPPLTGVKIDQKELKRKTDLLEDKLSQFSVKGKVIAVKPGPAVTMFEFRPNADVKISKITDLADDLSLALSSESVRIIAPIPGRDVVGIETSNSSREIVYLKEVIGESNFFSDDLALPLALGKDAPGIPKVVDLRKMPHLMVAGTTGSGKSVFVVGALTGLLFKHSPDTLKLILVDPKQVDLVAFHKVPHLIMPPIREVKKAVSALKWAIKEMDKRYRSMSRFGTRNLEEFNTKVQKLTKEQSDEHFQTNEDFLTENKRNETYHYSKQPYIVIVVEEFGDLMAVDKGNVENSVVRLAQMARACGIHLILAMQSPRKDVVTGLIKTNIPGRISFKVAAKMDSRIILDESGAERLLARGDMLYLAPGVSKPTRHHGPWVSEDEITKVMDYWSEQCEPEFDETAMRMLEGSGGGFSLDGEPSGEEYGPDQDDRYDEIFAFITTQKTISASFIQRKFKLGYPRAARLIEIFESEGVVGPANGSKPREVLVGAVGSASL
ncbi:MAG: DNA translocase FtsK [Bdellovibrionales bacterium]